MPDTKITALTAIVTVDPVADVLPIVDVSDTSMAASGTTKKITTNQILGAGGTATLGTLAVTGATTLTGALTANGAVNLGDAVGDAVTVNGSLTAYRGEVASAIRGAAAGYASVICDGSTSGTRVTSPCLNVGTGDFSMWVRFRVPTANPGATFLYGSVSGSPTAGLDTSGSFGLIQETSGTLQVINFFSGVFTNVIPVANFVSTYAGQIVDVVLTRATVASTTTVTLYINGTSVGTSTNAAFATTANSTFFHVGTASVGQCNTQFYRAAFYNRSLSATDVTDLIELGIAPSDMWGTQTPIVSWNPAILNGGFETNSLNASGTWATSSVGASTATIDTSGSFSRTGTNAGKFTLDGSASFTGFTANNSSLLLWPTGKRVRLSFWARRGASSGSCGVQFGAASSGAVYGSGGLVLTTSYQNFTFEFVTVIDGGFAIGRQSGSAANAEIYIDDITLERIGAIVNLNFDVGTGFQATDNSTNALHGTLFGGTSWTRPRNVAVLYATTNTSGNQQMLGSTALPTNAIIEDIIVNSTGSATVSVGNVSAGTQIVNGASVVSGRQRLTIATPFTTTGNLWVNSSSTATLQFTILYTIAA